MKEDDFGCLGFFIAVSVICFFCWVASSVAHRNVDNWWRDELVRRGHADYYLDGANNRQWNWKEKP